MLKRIKKRKIFSQIQKVSKKVSKINFLEKIGADEALKILKRLSQGDRGIRSKIRQVAKMILSDVCVEDVAADVQMALETLEFEELKDQPKKKRVAYTLLDEAMKPFLIEMKRYQNHQQETESIQFCMGILLGLDLFESKYLSDPEDSLDEVICALDEYFYFAVEQWRRQAQHPIKGFREMQAWFGKHYPLLKKKTAVFRNQS